jgi:prepilin-type N-terminal cleavage/methylation domain-containing protein
MIPICLKIVRMIRHNSLSAHHGFSLTEVMIALAVSAIMMGFAVPMFNHTIGGSQADAAAQLIAQQLSLARIRAIGTQIATTVQIDPNANSILLAPGTTNVRGPFPLPGKMTFISEAPATDTPDGLGGTILGVDARTQVAFINNGAATTDGNGSNLMSGTFFIQRGGNMETLRAVTLVGGTGRTRIWRFNPANNTWN